MRKSACCVMVLWFVAVLAAVANAATLTGTVYEAGTTNAINAWGDLYAYRYEASTEEWVIEGRDYVDSGKTAFSMADLPAGTYYLFIGTNGQYISKFYLNTTRFDKKNTFNLKATQTKNLGILYLAPLPIRMANFQVTGSPVPVSGGIVRVSCDVVNDTDQNQTVLVWAFFNSYRVIYNETPVNSLFEFAPPQSVTVAPHSSDPVEFAMEVRSNLPEGYHDIEMNCGTNRWTPLTPRVWAGTFHTGPEPD